MIGLCTSIYHTTCLSSTYPCSYTPLPTCTYWKHAVEHSTVPLLSVIPGMILSPAADPFPKSLVQRLQSGQFVEMRDMLADNIALLIQVSSLHGTDALPQATVNRMRLCEVPSIIFWLYCFNTYIALWTNDNLSRQMLA